MINENGFYFLLVFILLTFTTCGNIKKDISEDIAPSEEVSTKQGSIFSTLVSKNGEIVFEEYYNGKSKDSLCDVQSLTKGLMSILVGKAIDEGFINNVNEPIAKYFPQEFENLADMNKRLITIKQILNQTSGLSWKGYLEHDDWQNSADPISFVLNKKMESYPGEKYNYNSGASHLLSVIVSRATDKPTLAFAIEELFAPMGIELVEWDKRNKGYHDGSGLGLKMKPMDLMKIGQLLENDGKWNGLTIISEKWVERLFDGEEKLSTQWGLKDSKHGFCWYQSQFNGYEINYGMGYGGQFILLIPQQQLIIVATHNHDTPTGIEQQIQFLLGKLPNLIERHSN